MAGLQFPIELLGGLSWNRLIRETYTAKPVPDPLTAKRAVMIPPVPLRGNGFIYLVGCSSDSALPSWRLGCSVRLSSNGIPDSGGMFTDPNDLPIRIDDRRPCTLGCYTLLTWPNLEIKKPWLILEFPFWLDDIEVEIFWYDGAVTVNFFEQVRESLLNLYQDPDFLNQIGGATNDYVDDAIEAHLQSANPHPQYLSKIEAANTYALPLTLENAIAAHEADLHDPLETEQTIASIADARAQAAIDAHLAADNPHGITATEGTFEILSVQSPWVVEWGSSPKVHKQDKIVLLSGSISCSTALSQDTLICILPVGYRPGSPLFLPAWIYCERGGLWSVGNDGIFVLTSGEVYGSLADVPTKYAFFSLAGCCFVVD